MERFEYEITKHPADQFKQIVIFCSKDGECGFDQLPSEQMKKVEELLNERGSQGWELVQLFFDRDGVIAFWKRAL